MEYFKCRWIHSNPEDPVLIYSELDDERWETRKVEIFADGRKGFASATQETAHTGTWLGEVAVPTLEEIAVDPQFEPVPITKEEFEAAWANRISPGSAT